MAKTYHVYGGFGTGGGNIKDEITPFLRHIEGSTKGEAVRAIRSVAYETHVLIKRAITNGSADGIPIPERKKLDSSAALRLHQNMRKRRPRKGRVYRRLGDMKEVKKYMLRKTKRFMGDSAGANRSLLRAVNYAKTRQRDGYTVGWGSKSAASFGKMVQAAGRGWSFKRVQGYGSTPISAKQKRFFAAIGLPTKKTSFSQPRADFFGPLMIKRQAWMGKIFENKIREYIRKREVASKR